jgi:peptidoglycan/xylan/chitin deacetylase (PgdA/CDA1 family)
MKVLSLAQLWPRQWVKTLINPGGLILMYHRIAEVPTDPFSLCVAPRHFAEHLSAIKQHSHPMSLQKMVHYIQQGKLPRRALAITFDDGYADNLFTAKPLLEKYNIPATVFITTGYLGHKREAWWDELDQILLQHGNLPELLCLTIDEKNYQWDLGDTFDYSEEAFQRDCTWTWYTPTKNDPGPRQRIYRFLYELLYPISEDEKQRVLDNLLEWAGMHVRIRSTHRFLSPTEVPVLGQGELIKIGAHTVNHPFLSTIPITSQWQEIEQSKIILEELTNESIQSFAYPHGNYSPEIAAVVRNIGFNCACTTEHFQVQNQTDCFQLPRIGVEDWDGEEFARQLSRWFDD